MKLSPTFNTFRPRSFFPGFDGSIPESPATAATPADGAGEVVSGSCGCIDGYIPERNGDSELVKCRSDSMLYQPININYLS